MNTPDFLNTNGLVNGKIPAGTCCSFQEECILFSKEECPNIMYILDTDYSCAAARAFSLDKR